MSPSLEGSFLTPGPPGKSQKGTFKNLKAMIVILKETQRTFALTKRICVLKAIKKRFDIPWKKNYDQPRQHIKKQKHYFADTGPSSQSYGFSSGLVWM